jgi:regulator of sigma E protease
MHVLKIIVICLEVLVLFNLLIFVHEFGHFLAARWRGLKVERFAIWFGKPIWKATYRDVEYCLGCIPAGGYVSLPQMADMEAIEGKTETKQEALPPISSLDKIIVAFAGPLFSFLLAIAFAALISAVGRPVSEAESTTVIGYVEKDGPADKAGLKQGDRILEVDGKPVKKFGGMGESVTWRIVRSEGQTVLVKVERNGQVLTVETTPTKEPTKAWQRKSLRQILIAPAQRALVAEVATNSPAAKAGLKPGDEVVALDGQKIHHFSALGDFISGNPGKELVLTCLRENRPFEIRLKPVLPVNASSEAERKPRIGVVWDATGHYKLIYPGTIEQVVDSVNAMSATFGALFSRKSDIKPQHLGGAVKIFSVYYMLFESEQGWRLALWFSVVLNVNLALLNLLPFPVLDGGHIVLAILESIRKRPVNLRFLKALQTGCAVVLIAYMLYIAFFDVQELPWGGRGQKPPAMQFAPENAETR